MEKIKKIRLVRNPCCGLAVGIKIINAQVECSLCDWYVSSTCYGALCGQHYPFEVLLNSQYWEIEITKDGWYGKNGLISQNTSLEWWDISEFYG